MVQNPSAVPRSMVRLIVSPMLAVGAMVEFGLLSSWSSPIAWPVSCVRVSWTSVDTQLLVTVPEQGGESTTVKLKPGNTVRPQEFWEAVRRNGFTPKETRVLVRGEVTNSASLQLKVTGSNQLLDLKADSTLLEEARRQIGKIVTVEGALTPGKDLKPQIPLDVRSIRSDK